MHLKQNLFAGKRKYLFGVLVLSFISMICAAFSMTGSTDYEIARREVLLRRIGHEVLLQSGDRTSRVLPINTIAENEYEIGFENELVFVPESLVNTTRHLLTDDPLGSEYVVKVLNCGTSSVAYGYSIAENKKDDIVTCKGRRYPRACYKINVKFKPAGINTARNGYLLGSLPFLAFIGFVFLRAVKPRRVLPKGQAAAQSTDLLPIGAVLFDAKNRTLQMDGQAIDLTGTETRLLLIFATSPNEMIERSRLQKEIWEDEGVIVGRSLDMFISKLRKKLELDPNCKIVAIRGKGYKLEISV